ncbi:MAG: phospholipase D-like domain-containing protein, partial [Burkholderiales bacterium]
MSWALRRFLAVVLLLAAAALPSWAGAGQRFPATGSIELAFTPEDNAIHLMVEAIRQARRAILVQAFSFTSNEIAFALIEAKRRGVDVQVVADGEQTVKLENSRIPLLARAGIPVWLDDQHAAADYGPIHRFQLVPTGPYAAPRLPEIKGDTLDDYFVGIPGGGIGH